MNAYGPILHRLRTERGLSQVELGESAGVSGHTIYRIESGATETVRRSTAGAILRVLERAAPLSPTDAAAYVKAAGLEAAIAATLQESELLRSVMHDENVKRALHSRLDEIVGRFGAHAASALLHAAEALALASAAVHESIGRQADEEPVQEIRVVGPPVQKPGYVEHIETTYARPASDQRASPDSSAKPRRTAQ